MYRNMMIELTKYVNEPNSIGSKLKHSLLSDQITQAPEETIYTDIRTEISTIKDITLIIQKNSRSYATATRPQKRKQYHDRINVKITEGNKLMKSLKTKIQQLKKQEKVAAQNGDTSHSVDNERIIMETTDALKNYKEAQQQISEQIKNTIHRQANLIKGQQVSEKELEELLLHPEKGQEMLQEKLFQTASVQLQNAVSDIVDKCNDVLKLERSMRQCMEMMQEMALLVHLQGQKLTTIEEVINKANNHVAVGDAKLQKGKQYHKKSKKKMCCIMMLLILIIGIIVIPIVITKI